MTIDDIEDALGDEDKTRLGALHSRYDVTQDTRHRSRAGRIQICDWKWRKGNGLSEGIWKNHLDYSQHGLGGKENGSRQDPPSESLSGTLEAIEGDETVLDKTYLDHAKH
jgi:hypothetical protein